jgi:GT2 family glycosyltransferase
MALSRFTRGRPQENTIVDRDAPAVSIVIPTRNRCGSLRRTLDALRAQTTSSSTMEVLVVLDACTDDTPRILERYEANFRLRTLALDPPHKGPATARNLGARSARGPLLLFLDDDVVPDACLVQAHIDAHRTNPNSVVLGPYLPVMQRGADCFRVLQQTWWNDKFLSLQQYGHRFSYTDVLTGNLSIQTYRFAEVGGFDERFPAAHEDYELGLRLIQAGLRIVVARNATARHYEHEHMTVERSFERARMEGRADVLLAHRHASVIHTLLFVILYEQSALPHRVIRWLAYDRPSLGDTLAKFLGSFLPLLNGCRFRVSFHRIYKGLRYYWYLRGAAQEAGSASAVSVLLENNRLRSRQHHETDLDLRKGLTEAEAQLDHERPEAARLWYGRQFIGRIPFLAGSERLRGEHLRPVLASSLSWRYLMCLVMETAGQSPLGHSTADFFQSLAVDETSHAGKTN